MTSVCMSRLCVTVIAHSLIKLGTDYQPNMSGMGSWLLGTQQQTMSFWAFRSSHQPGTMKREVKHGLFYRLASALLGSIRGFLISGENTSAVPISLTRRCQEGRAPACQVHRRPQCPAQGSVQGILVAECRWRDAPGAHQVRQREVASSPTLASPPPPCGASARPAPWDRREANTI